MLFDFVTFLNGQVSWNTATKQRLLDDFTLQTNYQDTINDVDGNPIPNPITKKDAVNQAIQIYILQTVEAGKLKDLEQSRQDTIDEVRTTFAELVV